MEPHYLLKIKIIELLSDHTPAKKPKAITIQSKNYNEYIKLIEISKSNNIDWLILQPMIKKNTTDKDCYNFFKKIISKGSIGMAEAYMNNEFETDNLSKLIELTAKNIEIIHRFSGILDLSFINYLKNIFNKNTKSNSKKNNSKSNK